MVLPDKKQRNTGFHHVPRSLKVKGESKRPKKNAKVQSSWVESCGIPQGEERIRWCASGTHGVWTMWLSRLRGMAPAIIKSGSAWEFGHWWEFSWSPGSYFNWRTKYFPNVFEIHFFIHKDLELSIEKLKRIKHKINSIFSALRNLSIFSILYIYIKKIWPSCFFMSVKSHLFELMIWNL